MDHNQRGNVVYASNLKRNDDVLALTICHSINELFLCYCCASLLISTLMHAFTSSYVLKDLFLLILEVILHVF